ncbi:MAG: type II secretion system protein [Campylobacter sp.]|nr:type II secretion system protein [Campylobacter sp.]
MKNGFTMVELIFTIIILAVTTMAIPRMVAQTTELNVFAIKQELVSNAKTVLTEIYRSPWDSSYLSVESKCIGNLNNCSVPVKIYSVAGSNVDNNRPGIVGMGGTAADHREFAGLDSIGNRLTPTTEANFTAVSFGPNAFNDIDDYNGYEANITSTNIAGNTSGDFILNSDISVAVRYLQEPNITTAQFHGQQNLDFNLGIAESNNPTNIKMITVTARDNTDAQSIVLRSYSHNIGTAIINHRTIQNF